MGGLINLIDGDNQVISHGGKRPGSGRKKGGRNALQQKAIEIACEVLTENQRERPLEGSACLRR